ncbi:MAG: S-layer homology domain-containing protein, partial [Candidatus Margulisiibacteriota bacterium]
SQSEIKVLKKSNQVQVNINEVKQVSKTTKKIFGKINQDVPFTINYRKVSANSDGSFDFLLPLNQDQIVVTFLNQKFIKDVSLNPRKEPVIVKQPVIEEFQDLKNHWVKDIANKLKASGKLDNTSNFDPNAKISRADLAKYLVKINDLKTKVGAQDLTFSDVSKNDKDYAYIQAVTKNKLMKGMSKTTYDKNSNVTRIQALIVASRLLPDKENASNTSLPFQDISKYKWATKNIRKAYDYKLISPSSKLNPKQEITRAELITLLFRASNA